MVSGKVVNILVWTCILSVCLIGGRMSGAAEPVGSEELRSLLAGLSPQPTQIGLKVWLDKDPGGTYHEGDRVIATVQAERNGYLVVIGVAGDGSVSIIIPKLEGQDGSLEKGTVYTIFGDDSDTWLALGKPAPWSFLAFCVTSKKVDRDLLIPDKGRNEVSFGSESKENFRPLKENLQRMALDEGFNRVILPVAGAQKQGFVLTLKEPVVKRAYKRIPGSEDSETPTGVTGTQGQRPEKKQK